MRRMLVIQIVTVLLVGSGCAYRAAMGRGERAETAGDWPAALDAYTQAFQTKPTTEAADAMAGARGHALEIANGAAMDALQLHDYATVADRLQYMRQIAGDDEPMIPDLEKATTNVIRGDIGTRVDEGLTESAYDLALQVSGWGFGQIFADEMLDRVRDAYRRKAETLGAEGKFEEAIAALDKIVEKEPERKDLVALPMHDLRLAWADTLVVEASARSRAGRKGAAAVLYARAYELAGRQADLDTARGLADALRADTQLKYYLKVEGDQWYRVKHVRDGLREKLDAIENVVRGGETTSTMSIGIDLGKASCSESKTAEKKEVEYVSGQIDVPAPTYTELEARMAELRAQAAKAEDDKARIQTEHDAAATAMQDRDAKVEEARKTQAEAKKSLERAEKQLQTQRETLSRLEQELKAASDAEKPNVEAKIATISANAAEWEAEVSKWQSTEATASNRMATLEMERAPAADALARMKAALDAVAIQTKELRDRIGALNAEMTKTSPTMKEDVKEMFKYTEYAWTRVCAAPVRAGASLAWKTSLDRRKRIDPELKATDVSHVGHEGAKIAEDPKDYGASDREAIDQGDTKSLEELSTWATGLAREYFALEASKAIARIESDPDGAVDTLLSLYVGAGSLLDEATVSTFTKHIEARYGLKSPQYLRPEPTTAG